MNLPHLFSELKRRRVFQVAGVYLAAAWAMLNGATVLAPLLNLPAWAPRLVLFLLIVGFPVALVLAWAYDVTPEGIARTAPVGTAAPAGAGGSGRRRVAYLTAAAVLLLVAVGAYARWGGPHAGAKTSSSSTAGPGDSVAMDGGVGAQPVRFMIEPDSGLLGAGTPLLLQNSAAAISPNGRVIVYVASGGGGSLLYVRPVDELTARPLAGTEGGDWPFFSPDGAWVAFYSKGTLWKVRLSGGAPVPVTQVSSRDFFVGGCWLPDDTILFAELAGHLYRVPAAGGVAARVVLADTTLHLRNPEPLPDRRAVLVTVTEELVMGRVGVLDLASRRVRQFGPGLAPHYVAGQIVYGTYDRELYRRAFRLDSLAWTGAAERIANGLAGGATFDVSAVGAVVYRLGSERDPDSLKLAVMDRKGRTQRVFPIGQTAQVPRFAADGRRVVRGDVAPGRDSGDVWITDIVDGATQRVTAEEKDGDDAQWSPDGRSLAYTVNAPGGKDILVQALDGGAVRRFPRPGIQWTSDWVRQGNVLLFTDLPQSWEGDWDIWIQPLDGTPARPYLREPGHHVSARVSPDGRWAAYASDETGQFEVYVRSYPTPGRKTVASAAGGMSPVWSPDGRELYYWQRDELVAARLDAGAAGAPPVVRSRTPLFRAPYVNGITTNYDVSPDGKRFVIVTSPPHPDRLVVVLNALGDGLAADGPSRR